MRYTYLFVLGLTIFVSACTRPVADKPSSMTIAMPKQMKLKAANSTQAVTGMLAHVAINVRGTGIDIPISANYDADKHDNTPPTALPGSFTLDVPPGSARLIQIMAVYIDPTTMIGDFYYGDVTQDLVSGDNNIMIPMSIAGSGNVKGGSIAGRYYLVDGTTPSGMIESRFQPSNGNPAMVIERNFMLNGWFSTFALDTFPMDVVLTPTGQKIFSALTLSKFDSTTLTDNKKMKVLLPDRYQSYGMSSGDNKKSETAVIGFFGDGVPSAVKVCFASPSLIFKNLFTDSTKSTAVQWLSSSTNTADVRAVKSSAVVACTATDLAAAYTTVIPFTPSLLDNWGGSEAVPGFMGVFRFPTTSMMGSSPVQVSYNTSGQYTAQFSVLPDTSTVADSIGVFYRSYNKPQDYNGNGGGGPCQDISNGGLGFSSISSIPLVAGTLDYIVNNPSPPDIGTNSVMAFCPMKNGVAVGGGFVTDSLNTSMALTANSFTTNTQFNTVGVGQCHKIRLSLVNDSNGMQNSNVYNTSTRSFTWTVSGAAISFYADEASCLASTPTVSSVSIAANNVNGEIWFKDSTNESGQVTIASNSFGTTLNRQTNLTFTSPGSATTMTASEGSVKMNPNECRMVDVYMVSSTNVPSPTNTTINLTKTNLSGTAVNDPSFGFYTDCLMTTAITSLSFTSNDFRKSFAIKAGSAPSSDRLIQLTGTGSFKIYFNVTPLADHLAVTINNGNPVYKGSCVPLVVQAKDSAGANLNSAFEFNMNIYHPTVPGNYGELRMNCGSTQVQGPFTLATGSYSSLTFLAKTPQTGMKMETSSIFQKVFSPVNFDIRPAPPVDRASSSPGSTLALHLMSDELKPSLSQAPLSSWPILDAVTYGPTSTPSLSNIEVESNPRINGALFTSTSSLMSGNLGGSTNSPVMMTIKFKFNSLPAAGTAVDVFSLSDGGSWKHKIFVDDLTGGVFKIKGSGIWTGPDIIANTWYTVSLSNDGSGNTHGWVNGGDYGAGGSNAGNSGANYASFSVGSGFVGAVKAVVIDVGTGANLIDLTSTTGDHQYISNRVPDN